MIIVDVSDKQREGTITAIRHVLFDADGVLQELPGGWVAAAEPYFGERTMEFLQRSYETQLPTLAGQGDHLVILATILADFGATAPLEDIFRDIWLAAVPAPASLALCVPCATAGTACTWAPTRNGTGRRTCARCSATTPCST